MHARFERTQIAVIDPPTDQTHTALIVDPLIQAIKDLFNSNITIDRIEFLSWPSATGQRYAVNASAPKLNPGESRSQSIHQSSYGTDRVGLSPLSRTILDKLEARLPSGVDIKLGSVDFTPLGQSFATTSRFAIRNDQLLPARDELTTHLFERFLREMRDEPHLYQVILQQSPGTGPGSYTASIRVALYGGSHQYRSEDEFRHVARFDPPFDPITHFAPELPLSSNLDIFMEYLNSTSDDIYVAARGHTADEANIRTLARSKVEYLQLLRNSNAANPAYQEEDYYGRIAFRERDLEHILGIVPVVRASDPWAQAPGRAEPAFELSYDTSDDSEPDSLHLDAATDGPTDGESTLVTPGTDEPMGNLPNDGNNPHQQGIKTVAQIFREYGWTVSIVTQDTKSRPDLWCQTSEGEVYAVEVESENRTKSAKLLNNLARAEALGYEVIVVTLSEDAAEWAATRIAKPFADIDGDRTKLYNRSSTVDLDDGSTVLLPAESDTQTAEWWLTPDGTLELVVDDEQITSGSIDDPLHRFTYPLDRSYEDDEGRIVVEGPDGATKHVYANPDDFTRTALNKPHPSRDLSYFDIVESVRVLDGSELRQYQPSAAWDTTANTKRHEGSIDDFFGTFVVEREDERLIEAECRDFARQWIAFLTPHGPPANNVFGQFRQPHAERGRYDPGDGEIKFYKNRTWRYPRGIDAPALPSVDIDPAIPAEWQPDASGSGDEAE